MLYVLVHTKDRVRGAVQTGTRDQDSERELRYQIRNTSESPETYNQKPKQICCRSENNAKALFNLEPQYNMFSVQGPESTF